MDTGERQDTHLAFLIWFMLQVEPLLQTHNLYFLLLLFLGESIYWWKHPKEVPDLCRQWLPGYWRTGGLYRQRDHPWLPGGRVHGRCLTKTYTCSWPYPQGDPTKLFHYLSAVRGTGGWPGSQVYVPHTRGTWERGCPPLDWNHLPKCQHL